jgi:hypothetical protein
VSTPPKITVLRWSSFAANVVTLVGVPLLLGAAWWVALAIALAAFALSYWAAGCAPAGDAADPVTASVARNVADRMGLAPPRFVRRHPGWIAGAARVAGGYGLVVGEEIESRHTEAILAHELAHVASGDLAWEPFTDGFARALAPTVRKLPPLLLVLFPFFLIGAPLARATELHADDVAAGCVSSYPSVIKEVADALGSGGTLLYPDLVTRARRSARRSLRINQ